MKFLIFIFLCAFAEVAVIMPNGKTLPYVMEDGVKVFHLIAEPVKQEFVPGLIVDCWGYNGQSPGPMIEAVEGDRVRILVTNRLSEPTTVHWHGILVPNGMDGVTGLTQPPIPPGATFKYEFTLKQSGTYMYHPHDMELTQIGLGMMGFFIIHPKEPQNPPIDRDFAIFLHEWAIPPGSTKPDPMEMVDFNYFTFNGVIYPKAAPLVIKQGERVKIRLANLSMDNHPMHLHGYAFTVTATGGWTLPETAQYKDVTIDVPPGTTKDIEFVADAPGDWAFHCHKTHHTMSGMEHSAKEMQEAAHAHFKPPIGGPGQFGLIDMSGMFTIIKVRQGLSDYKDPPWYKNPPGTIAAPVK